MQVAALDGILPFLKRKISLPESSNELQQRYKSALPFPHLVLDDMFASDILHSLIDEIPPLNQENWVDHDEKRLSKLNLRSAVYLGEASFQFVSFIHSAAFLYLLSEITGIPGLLPDPYLGGGGYHVIPLGGRFDVHADRNVDQITGLLRRVVMIIYLNEDWHPEYGGQLELWNAEGTRCEEKIIPEFNRTILFEVGDKNFHGVRPVVGNHGRGRKSFAFYFHTTPMGEVSAHNSVYAPNCYIERNPVKEFMMDLVPPIVRKTVKRVRGIR
jgi:2OG-Fe(II) oxygenase superfamily